MTPFYATWIVIVFLWGGLGYTAYLLNAIGRANKTSTAIDLKVLRRAICLLFPFIVFASVGLTGMIFVQFAWPRFPVALVFTMNLLTGIFFLLFLVQLKRSLDLTPKKKTQNKAMEGTSL